MNSRDSPWRPGGRRDSGGMYSAAVSVGLSAASPATPRRYRVGTRRPGRRGDAGRRRLILFGDLRGFLAAQIRRQRELDQVGQKALELGRPPGDGAAGDQRDHAADQGLLGGRGEAGEGVGGGGPAGALGGKGGAPARCVTSP